MSAGMWFVVWVFGLASLGSAKGILGVIQGAFIGFVLWCICGIVAFVWGAMSVNYCEEYGYPDLHDTSIGKTCSDEEIQYYLEHNR